MTEIARQRDRIVDLHRDALRSVAQNDPPWLAPVRSAAIERFSDLGFPTRKREDWKYTDVAPIAGFISNATALEPSGRGKFADTIDTTTLGHVLVFVDGHCDRKLSHVGALPTGVLIDSLSRVLRERPELAKAPLTRPATADDRAFVALNAAFQRMGALVEIPDGVGLDMPIHLLFVSTAASDGHVHQPHNLIRLGANARATVVARYVSAGGETYATNAVTEVDLAPGARLDHVGFEREGARAFHIGTLTARVARDADFRSHALSLGAGFARHEIHSVLAETGASCSLNGLFIASGRRHVDNQTIVEHTQPHGTSRELYKGILGGHSTGVFNGSVIVHPGAQKTNAQQSNPNLLTSGRSEINSRPNLEIHADDVKCTHGSTVGRLDDDALFFLRARGIYDRSARQMLCHAFASEVLDEIPDDLVRDRLGRRVDEALREAGREDS